MGWFTYRSKLWEIRHTFIFLSVIGVISFISLGVLTPLVVLLFASNVKMSRWVKTSLFISSVYLVCLFFALFGFIVGENPISLLKLNYISFYIYVIYFSIYVPEYLQRLDLKNYINLEKSKEYSYYSIMEQLAEVQSNDSLRVLFLTNLNRFKQLITNKDMIAELDEISRLVGVININDDNVSEVLLERHVSTIENALIQYIELTNNYRQNELVRSSILKLEELVKYARLAFEKELSVLIETQVLKVDGESSVYLSVLKGRGLA